MQYYEFVSYSDPIKIFRMCISVILNSLGVTISRHASMTKARYW
jgi:hypothetical protein